MGMELEDQIQHLNTGFQELIDSLYARIAEQQVEINRLKEYEYMYNSVSK